MDIKSYNFYYELRSLSFVEQTWLFGSRARGSAQESDFVVAVVCPNASAEDWDIIKKIVKDADSVLKLISFDLILFPTKISCGLIY